MPDYAKIFLDTPKKRFVLELPEDVVLMLDDCSHALGLSRSAFLSILFRALDEQIQRWTEGFLTGYYYLLHKQNKDLEQTQEALENLGVKTTIRKRKR